MARLEESFREHRRLLWGVCYRMTGSASDADDLLQDTFARALEHPPDDDRPLRPWLVTVAVNLAKDELRRRKRRGYDGPWLPAPVETAEIDVAPEDAPGGARYELYESASLAFLVALEALSPLARAVLILRDVLDYSVRETAEALAISEANAKVAHHRARAKMADYERARVPPSGEQQDKTRAALERFLTALATQDAAAVASLLAADVKTWNDGGGEFHAARNVLAGADRTARFFLGLARPGKTPATTGWQLRDLNGLPAVVLESAVARPPYYPRAVIALQLDAAGKIAAIYTVSATAKLARI